MRNRSILSLFLILTLLVLTACTSQSGAKTGSTPQKSSAQTEKPEKSSVQTEKPELAAVTETQASWKKPEGRLPLFLFIHHSVGSGFLDDGGMRDKLKVAGFDVHERTYSNGWIGDHTDPKDFPVTFTKYYDDMISWGLAPTMEYDIVAFKSCFPASDISSDDMLLQYEKYYTTIKLIMEEHPHTLFIAFSTPPLVPSATKPENAKRARAFANWLADEYQKGEGNIKVYNLFDKLADDSNVLKKEYRRSEEDSHPNKKGNVAVADDFTKWLTALAIS